MAPIDHSSPLIRRAKEIAQEFEFDANQINAAVREFQDSMDRGLQREGETMSMIPTYVTSIPNGTEKGTYLALDLGGTNFRVCSVTLHGDTTFTLTQAKSAIPKEFMTGTTHKLFSFLASKIGDFIKEHHSEHFEKDFEHHLRLGFTFSFPVDQKGINKGYLMRWTKGFDIQDAVGEDVCQLLQQEIDALELPVIVAALVNDTVGTLMARSYTSPGKSGALIGAIFGTGTNGAYVGELERITKLFKEERGQSNGRFDTSTGKMVINTEWGNFDNELKVLPDTPYDRALDAKSVNPGMQMFEKRVSGMFLGEIIRNAIVELKESRVGLFEGDCVVINDDAELYREWTIDTSFLSSIEADMSEEFVISRKHFETELGVSGASATDVEAVKIISRAVGRRSARLSAVPLAAIVIKTKLEEVAQTRTDSLAKQMTRLSFGGDQQVDFHNADERPIGTLVYDALSAVVARIRARVAGRAAPLIDEAQEMDVIDVGVDGSVVEYYPGFEKHLREALVEVEHPLNQPIEPRIRIGIAKDGSGVGAALIALVASL